LFNLLKLWLLSLPLFFCLPLHLLVATPLFQLLHSGLPKQPFPFYFTDSPLISLYFELPENCFRLVFPTSSVNNQSQNGCSPSSSLYAPFIIWEGPFFVLFFIYTLPPHLKYICVSNKQCRLDQEEPAWWSPQSRMVVVCTFKLIRECCYCINWQMLLRGNTCASYIPS